MEHEWMIEDSEPCDCSVCKSMCNRPCWPLPEEAETLIDAGYAHCLMRDYWAGSGYNNGDIDIISPATPGHEGQSAPFWPNDGCTFVEENGHCAIHDIGKPYEGRIAHHDHNVSQHKEVAMTWNTDKGRTVVKRWYRVLKES